MAETFSATPLYVSRSKSWVLVAELSPARREYLGVRARTWTLGFRAAVTIQGIEDFYNARGGNEAFNGHLREASSISARFEKEPVGQLLRLGTADEKSR